MAKRIAVYLSKIEAQALVYGATYDNEELRRLFPIPGNRLAFESAVMKLQRSLAEAQREKR